MAKTCASLKQYLFLIFLFSMNLISFELFIVFHFKFNSFAFAVSGVMEFLIIFITLSKFSTATDIPIKICALSCAFFKSNSVFLVTVSSLKDKK